MASSHISMLTVTFRDTSVISLNCSSTNSCQQPVSTSPIELQQHQELFIEVLQFCDTSDNFLRVGTQFHQTPYQHSQTHDALDEQQSIVISSTRIDEVQTVTITGVTSGLFTLKYDNRTSSPMRYPVEEQDMQRIVSEMFRPICTTTTLQDVYLSQNFETTTMNDTADGTDIVVTTSTSYCGNYSLYLHDIGKGNSFRLFELGNAFQRFDYEPLQADSFTTDQFPCLCMAYRVPATTIIDLRVQIDNSKWVVMPTTNTWPSGFVNGPVWQIQKDGLWHYDCLNIHESLLQVLGILCSYSCTYVLQRRP